MPLLIVESPAKCKKIQGFLGAGWKVIATMGHIRALEEDLDAVGLNRDFEPRYKWLQPEKTRAINGIRETAAEFGPGDIYLASDDDREGEAISYSVCQLLRLDPARTPRVVFHEITSKAVLTAVSSPRRLDMSRVNAQQARAMLDMLIGFTMSPLLWKQFGFNRAQGGALSAGRCQIPALRLVAEREQAIADFKGDESWRVNGVWNICSSNCGDDISFPGHLLDSLEDEESALNYLEIHTETEAAFVTQKTTKTISESAPKPLITSTLQQQASAMFHAGPKVTMRAAQTLYESGHITYMRTDQPVLSKEAITQAHEWIRLNLGENYIGSCGCDGGGSGAVAAQAAHEAIRPTHFEIRELPGEYSPIERKIYGLIWQRAVQSTMSAARGEKINVIFRFPGEDDFTWESEWRRTTFQGWRAIGRVANIDEEGEDNEQDSERTWKVAQTLKEGQALTWINLQAQPQESRPLARYTEATLVRDLEKKGIGRPSTFASLIATIQDRVYVETRDIPGRQVTSKSYTLSSHHQWPPTIKEILRTLGHEKGKLVPTEQGRAVLEFLCRKFNDLFEYSFTARMESRLDLIADGAEEWKQVLKDTWDSYRERYERAKTDCAAAARDRKQAAAAAVAAAVAAEVPIDGILWEEQPIYKRNGPYGMYVACLKGKLKVGIKEADSNEQILEKIQAKVNGSVGGNGGEGVFGEWPNYVVRQGPYGPYIMKKGLKKAQFVKLLGTIRPESVRDMSESDIEALYKAGLEAKKQGTGSGSFRGRGGGGLRGRGGARGRGGGRGRGRGGNTVVEPS